MLNKKGFTVIELIASFVFSSLLAVSLFAVILNYRDKQVNNSIETQLLAFKSELMIDIEQDIQKNGLRSMNYCLDESDSRVARCIIINFMDGSSKKFEVKEEPKVDVYDNLDGSSDSFNYTIPYISYGNVRYNIPDASNIVVRSDFLLETTKLSDGLETNTPLYRIRVNLIHNDLDADVDINIVAEGSENIYGATPPYATYDVGDRVAVILNSTAQLYFRVIKRSGGYDGNVVLLYDDVYNSSIPSSTQFNSSRANGNVYDSSSIKTLVDSLASSWVNAKTVRLITSEEVGYLVAACPKFKNIDAANLNITGSSELLSWLTSSSYWTMTPKQVSNASNQGKMVWYVDGSNQLVSGSYVDSTHALRPVIEVSKEYLTY